MEPVVDGYEAVIDRKGAQPLSSREPDDVLFAGPDVWSGHHGKNGDVYPYGVLLFRMFSDSTDWNDGEHLPAPMRAAFKIVIGAHLGRVPEIPDFF